MSSNITTINSFIMPEIESAITAFEIEGQEKIKLQGKQDAQREILQIESHFIVTVEKPIQNEAFSVIALISQRGQLASHVFNAKEFEITAQKQCEEMQFKYEHIERERPALIKKRDAIKTDPFKLKSWWWFLLASVAVGLADGALAYSCFRHSYSTLLALATSLAIAGIISTSHFTYAGWIKKSAGLQKWLKIGAILSIAFVFFYYIGSMRSQALANTVNVNPEGAQLTTRTVSSMTICIISFVLFSVVLALSLVFYRSAEERRKEEEYKKVSAEILQMTKEMQDLQIAITDLKEKVLKQKNDVRALHNYLQTSVQRVIKIGNALIALYKEVYARFRSNIPDFFAKDSTLVYDENIYSSETEKETVL